MLQNLTNLLISYGPWGLLLLGFADSAGIPVPGGMDALVIVLAAANPAGAPWYALLAVIGSAAGNVALFWAAWHGGRRFLDRQAPEGRTKRFREWFRRYGLLTVFIPALVPIPLPMKVFVISAGALQVPVTGFLAVILLARILRYGGEAWLGAQVGEHSVQYLKDHVPEMLAVSAALFILLYVLIRVSDRRHRPAADAG